MDHGFHPLKLIEDKLKLIFDYFSIKKRAILEIKYATPSKRILRSRQCFLARINKSVKYQYIWRARSSRSLHEWRNHIIANFDEIGACGGHRICIAKVHMRSVSQHISFSTHLSFNENYILCRSKSERPSVHIAISRYVTTQLASCMG